MKLTKRPFGALENGTAVHCWTMENEHGLRAELLDYGATIRSLQVPDRYGVLTDVVLGYDTLEGYVKTPGYLGATIGRLDEKMLFYLASRGIPEEAARSLLARARIEAVVDLLPEALAEEAHKFMEAHTDEL